MLPQKEAGQGKDVHNQLSLGSSVVSIQKSEMVFRDYHVNDYDRMPTPQAQLEVDFVKDELALSPGQKYSILDLGCGTGRALLSLIPYANSLVGVDFSLEIFRDC